MIGQLIGSLTGLATSIIDGKTQIKLTEAEIKKKQLTGEIDWDLEAMRATEIALGGIVSASIGMRSVSKFFGKK